MFDLLMGQWRQTDAAHMHDVSSVYVLGFATMLQQQEANLLIDIV